MSSVLAAGAAAPEFRLNSTPDQKVKLSEFRGSPVILAFYPADWSPVCGDQMSLYNEILPEFRRHGAQLLGISVDGVCERALFVLDADGVVRWSYVSPVGINPGADGILEALEKLGAEESAQALETVQPGADGASGAVKKRA